MDLLKKKSVVLLGATGSIGENTLRVARALPDQIQIIGLSGRNNTARLLELSTKIFPQAICTKDETTASFLKSQLGESKKSPSIFCGEQGLVDLATLPEADVVLNAIVGTAGLKPSLAALKGGKNLAVASKEILVMAGKQVMEMAKRHNAHILPVDSEHSAIFQCLEGRDHSTVRRIILTCSGGPFRETKSSDLSKVTPDMALRHPTWNMGRKISIDSATLFNKGLEMIEAHWLFNLPMEKIDVIIHPQSIIHSMVEFIDGSILAQMSVNNMMLPIQYAITYPHRIEGPSSLLDLGTLGKLSFEKPRHNTFPALTLARQAGTVGGNMPAILNAANEAAVERFLENKISFPDIWKSVEEAMEKIPFIKDPSLEELIETDQEARKIVQLQKKSKI